MKCVKFRDNLSDYLDDIPDDAVCDEPTCQKDSNSDRNANIDESGESSQTLRDADLNFMKRKRIGTLCRNQDQIEQIPKVPKKILTT